MTPHNAKINAQKEQQKFVEQMAIAERNHKMTVQFIEDTYINKLLLINVQQQGIERAFIVEVAAEFIGNIAVRIAPSLEAQGMWMDYRQILVYKKYSVEETAKFVEENMQAREAAKNLSNSISLGVLSGQKLSK